MKIPSIFLGGVLLLGGCLTMSCETTPVAETKPKDNLLNLVENQNLDRIREIFGLDTDVNSVNSEGRTALHVAASKDLAEIAAVLLARGAKVDLQDRQGKTPLHLAVEKGASKTIPLLLQYNASIFIADRQGRTSVQTALSQNPELISLLINEKNVRSVDSEGNSVLHLAAGQGLPGLVDFLLTLPVDVTQRNSQGETALDQALQFPQDLIHAAISWKLIQKGSPKPKNPLVEYFWKAGAASNTQMVFDLGNTALHFASERGHLGIARFLVENGAIVDARDIPGNTSLHRAIENDQFDVASYLIQKNAEVNAKDFNNNTALHLALTSKKPEEATDFLLKKGADPNLKNNFGNTPLHLIVSLNLSPELAQQLIIQGADVNMRNKLGNTPLFEAVKEKNKNLVTLLVASGANPFAINNQEESPLGLSVQYGPENLSWLIQSSNIASRDDNGNTALHLAVRLGDFPQSVGYLLDVGANPNDRNKLGQTPLHLAVQKQNLAVSKSLLKANADLYVTDNSGQTPLDAVFHTPLTFVDLFFTSQILEKKDASLNTPLFHAIFTSNLAVVQLLLKKGASLNARNLAGSSPLHEAVRLGNFSAAESLLKAGANVQAQDNLGNTPLHNLVFWDSVEMGNLLLSRGASIEAKNNEGRTALQEATRRGEISLSSYLLVKGADPNTRDKAGRTPLFDAVRLSNYDLTKLLLLSKASIDLRDVSGATVLHQAAAASSKSMVELLMSQGADLFAENARGLTPAAIALAGSSEMIKVFFNSRNINLQNNQGQTALHLAVVTDAPSISAQVLLDLGADKEIRNKDGKTALDLSRDLKRNGYEKLLTSEVRKDSAEPSLLSLR